MGNKTGGAQCSAGFLCDVHSVREGRRYAQVPRVGPKCTHRDTEAVASGPDEWCVKAEKCRG